MANNKYQAIKDHILAQIQSGEWQEGQAVPSENQLATDFSVSRMTARRALQELSEQGVLVRNQGAATSVASLKSQSSLLEIRNIADEIRQRKHSYQAEVITLEAVRANEVLAKQLAINTNDLVYYSCICHLENELPVQLEQRYVNPELVPEYLQQNFSEITPHEYLCDIAPLTEAEHQIEAVLASEQQQHWLVIDGHQPCLQIQRRTWSQAGMVSYALLTHPGNRYRLGGHLTFPA